MSVAELCANMITRRDKRDDLVEKNVIEFATSTWGLGLGTSSEIPPLYPAQRFIIKFYYGLDLDDSSKRDIIIKDKFNENELYRFNEVEYMNYLFNEGRLNKKFDGIKKPNFILVLGRRAGKTTITSTIIAYETYRLLTKYSPQEYYGIMPEQEIRITSVSTARDTATELFNMVTGHLERSEFFSKYRSKPTKQWMYLKTQRDLDKYGRKGRSSLMVHVAPCNAKSLRGHNNIIVALDEMAHFFENDKKSGKGRGKSDRDDREIYKAVTPSVAKFKKADQSPDGKIFCISSPAGKTGKFFEEYQRGFESDNEDLFVMRAPSWEIDPDLSSQYLRNKYKENQIGFRSEFGAEFSDRLFGWIDDASIVRQCMVPGFSFRTRSNLRVPHFMGIDIGLKNDGSNVTVGHWITELVKGAKEEILEVDLSDTRYADDENKDYFIPEELAEWIAKYTKDFYIVKGLMDQYYGMSIIPILHKSGHKQFEFRNFNDALNSTVYQNLLTFFISKCLKLPEGDTNDPQNPMHDSELVKEILTLQAEQKTKYLIKVSAPQRAGCHDDASDGLARLAFLANEFRNKGYGNKASTPVSYRAHNLRLITKSEALKASLGRPSRSFMNRGNRRGLPGMMPTRFSR